MVCELCASVRLKTRTASGSALRACLTMDSLTLPKHGMVRIFSKYARLSDKSSCREHLTHLKSEVSECPEALASFSRPSSLPLPLQDPLLVEHAVCLLVGTIETATNTSLLSMLWALFSFPKIRSIWSCSKADSSAPFTSEGVGNGVGHPMLQWYTSVQGLLVSSVTRSPYLGDNAPSSSQYGLLCTKDGGPQ